MAGEFMSALCCPLQQTTEEKELLSLKALAVNWHEFNLNYCLSLPLYLIVFI